MRHTISLLVFVLTGALVSVSALGQEDASELKTTKHILGPMTIGHDQTLKICMTDVAGITGAADKSTSADESSLIHTKILFFDSNDTTKALGDVDGRDFLVWQRQLGACVKFDPGFLGGVYVAAGDVNGDGLYMRGEPRSIIAILIGITEGPDEFQPVITGQLFSENDTPLIIGYAHEIKSPRDAAIGGAN